MLDLGRELSAGNTRKRGRRESLPENLEIGSVTELHTGYPLESVTVWADRFELLLCLTDVLPIMYLNPACGKF